MMKIEQISENKYKANSYVVVEENDCFVVDMNLDTISFIVKNNLRPVYLFLTHEHFDHIKGTTELKKLYPDIKIAASKKTSDLIISSQGNLSFFIDGVGFNEIYADIHIEDINEFLFKNKKITVYPAPGHTAGGIIIHIENMLFTGDTVLDIKTPTNLPNSSKKQLQESINFIDSVFSNDTMFYQGHGAPFYKSEWDKTVSLPVSKSKI